MESESECDVTGQSIQIDLYNRENSRMKHKIQIVNMCSIVLIVAFAIVDGYVTCAPCFQDEGSHFESSDLVT